MQCCTYIVFVLVIQFWSSSSSPSPCSRGGNQYGSSSIFKLSITFASARKPLFVSRVPSLLFYAHSLHISRQRQYTKRSIISQLARIHNQLFGETRRSTYLYKQRFLAMAPCDWFIRASMLRLQKGQQRKVCSDDVSGIQPLCQLFVRT